MPGHYKVWAMAINSVSGIPAFVLHSRPYRDSSAIVELFTQSHGRVAVVARGVKSAKCRYRGILQPFQPLLVSWSGRGEMFSLSSAEETGLPYPVRGQHLVVGLYVNELLMRSLGKGDTHEEIYSAYQELLEQLAQGGEKTISMTQENALRFFEIELLSSLGYGLILDRDAGSGELINAKYSYMYHPARGPLLVDSDSVSSSAAEVRVSGATLIALEQQVRLNKERLIDAKRLLRNALMYHLGNKPLRSRRLFQQYSKQPASVTSIKKEAAHEREGSTH